MPTLREMSRKQSPIEMVDDARIVTVMSTREGMALEKPRGAKKRGW